MELPVPLQLLLLLLLRLIDAEDGMKEVFGVVGSSVLLDPEYGADLSNSDIIWMFTGSSGKPVTILDYVPNHPKAEPSEQFKSRLHFNSSSGSLMLNNVKPSDQGVYTITVNEDWKRSTDLKLIEPLSAPLIISNSTCVNTTIELTCQVSAGKARSILWWKDNEVIMNDQRYQLVQNNSTLIISKANKSDCGIYTCTVENPVSKKNNSYSLSIYGLTQNHHVTVVFSIAALFIAATTLVTAIAAVLFDKMPCLNEDHKTKYLQLVQKMQQFLQIALVLSFIFLFFACLCWMQTEVCPEMFKAVTTVSELIEAANILFVEIMRQTGFPGMTVLMFLFLHLILITVMTCNRMVCDTHKIKKFLSNKVFRPILCAVTPLGGILAICASGIMIGAVIKRNGKGCEPATNLRSTIISAVVVTVVSHVIAFAFYLRYKKWKKRTTRTQSTNPNEKDMLQCNELKELFLNQEKQQPLNN